MISRGFPRPLHHKSQISAPRIISDFSWKIQGNRKFLLVVLISEILYLALNITPSSFKDLSNVKSEAKTSFFRLNVIEPIKVEPLTKKYTSCPRTCETFFFLVHILIFFHRSVEAMTFCKVGYFSRFEEFEVNWWDSLPMTADHSNQLHKHSQSSPPS